MDYMVNGQVIETGNDNQDLGTAEKRLSEYKEKIEQSPGKNKENDE